MPTHNLAHTNRGKVLRLHISSTGFTSHITTRRNIANTQLTKLQRFRNLNANNRIKVYTTLVRSKLIYPAIPIHIACKTQILRLQRVQNKGARFITNTSIRERITSEQLHEQIGMHTINVITSIKQKISGTP